MNAPKRLRLLPVLPLTLLSTGAAQAAPDEWGLGATKEEAAKLKAKLKKSSKRLEAEKLPE